MASIFTYDPDPPKVSSPWIFPDSESDVRDGAHSRNRNCIYTSAECRITKLQAEPQEGPIEYKLHLLLRSRRAYTSSSTSKERQQNNKIQNPITTLKRSTADLNIVQQTRQQRLQHLTTQLLWRLQQSSPYHASRSRETTIPELPDDYVDLNIPTQPLVPLPGLEESRGALYELGVSDDGTLIGLTQDEMNESLVTLRVMAASLGCVVEVVRMIIVGDCEWVECVESADTPMSSSRNVTKQGKLWVSEAFVTPELGVHQHTYSSRDHNSDESVNIKISTRSPSQVQFPTRGISNTPQLRITLTGPTTSGKSTLLGTLSTGTLDNGRGKSRLNLFRHRHEMVSGVTSSIAQELIGYKDQQIFNFSQGNIESWIDIHDRSKNGRIVFISDSGGHPRYRRTVLRGLMNWAPHWSILCFAADDAESASERRQTPYTGQEHQSDTGGRVDLVKAHLSLSLKLEVPVAIIVTKLDLASKSSLQNTMITILAAVKDAGRTPKILQPDQRQHDELKVIPSEDYAKARAAVETMKESGNLNKYVPIILTSAVKGIGIGLVHALLESLPLSAAPITSDSTGIALSPEQPKCLFHIDDTFNLQAPRSSIVEAGRHSRNYGVIISGYVRFGRLFVGARVVVGPFPSTNNKACGSEPETKASPGKFGLSASRLSPTELGRTALKTVIPASTATSEWHNAQIVSIRNLRLPVRALEAGQAGSIGLKFDSCVDSGNLGTKIGIHLIRRGMVLAIPSRHMTGLSLQAAGGFTAAFKDGASISLATGSLVNVYLASVRAVARVMQASHRHQVRGTMSIDDNCSLFGVREFTRDSFVDSGSSYILVCEVTLELLHKREWIELGSRVILQEGGRQDKSGLRGIVGRVVEIVD